MQLLDGRLIHTATDLASFLGCAYRAVLTREAARGHLKRPKVEDPILDRLAKRGRALEVDWMNQARASGRRVIEVARTEPGAGLDAIKEAAAQTLALMRAGTDVIVQGVLFDGTWLGYADVLERVTGTSDLGDYAYEVADTKLRGHVYAGAVVQLAQYTAQLGVLIGSEPRSMHVDLGDGRRVTVPTAHAAAFHRRLRDRYLQVIAEAVGLDGVLDPDALPPLVPVAGGRGRDGTPYPWVVPACRTCPWADACAARRAADDHLAAVPGMRRDHARRLHGGGVETRRALAALPPRDLLALGERIAVPEPILARHQEAAMLSVALSDVGRDRAIVVRTPPTEPPRGIWRVPIAGAGDVFLHADVDPYRAGRRFTYAAAVGSALGVKGEPVAVQALDDEQERSLVQTATRLLLPLIDRRRRAEPGTPTSHVFVWGDGAFTALRAAASRYGTCERDLQRLLDSRVIVDLRAITREAIRTARSVDALADLDRYVGITDLPDEVPLLAFDRLIAGEPNAAVELDAVMRASVRRLAHLRDWLLKERQVIGELPIRELDAEDPPALQNDDVGAAIASMLDLEKERRRAGGHDGERDARAARLLADLLRWHRREDSVQWLEYFGAMAADPADLIDHPSALGGLRLRGDTHLGVRRFTFPRGQEHRISIGDEVACHAWGTDSARLVVIALDTAEGTVDLKMAKGKGVAWPMNSVVNAIVPTVPAVSDPLRRALVRLANQIDTFGASPLGQPGAYRAARRLLLCETPVVASGSFINAGEEVVDGLRRLALKLSETALPVQGPPGTGKTHAAARMILDLIADGKRVGICANSHRAVANLLDATMDAAAEVGMTVGAVQRAKEVQRCRTESVYFVESNREAAQALGAKRYALFAGTAWLFASTDFDQALDALFIDEAGQMSLANALAAATSTRQLFLLGDPRQLAQPTRGDHPDGVGASALGHLIGHHETVPADRGVFLPVSWRMHPDICRFVSEQVYESRLDSHPDCAHQTIGPRQVGGLPIGSGLRRLEVRHAGNRVEAREEVLAIATACTDLIGVPWTDQTGTTRPLEPRDIIVVAPYNRQVDLLNLMLPPGVVAGTVDRFQGQEAVVVFYSMTASDAHDLSRGLEFLFGLDRLNVAISRARALAVLVASPTLLIATCRTAEEVRLVNAVCRLAELATPFA